MVCPVPQAGQGSSVPQKTVDKSASVVIVDNRDISKVMRKVQNNDKNEKISWHAAVKVGSLRRWGVRKKGRLPGGRDIWIKLPRGSHLSLNQVRSSGVWSTCFKDVHSDFVSALNNQLRRSVYDDDWVICVGYDTEQTPDLQLGLTGKVELCDNSSNPHVDCIHRETDEEANLKPGERVLFESRCCETKRDGSVNNWLLQARLWGTSI